MTDIYYQLADTEGNSLLFIPSGLNDTGTRDIWEMPIPFVKAKLLMDQITTSVELTQEGLVKGGTGRPYATIKIAIAAIKSLTPATRSSGWTLKGGDWNGSSWSYNSAYPELGDGDEKIIPGMVSYYWALGENIISGDIKVTINMKMGTIF